MKNICDLSFLQVELNVFVKMQKNIGVSLLPPSGQTVFFLADLYSGDTPWQQFVTACGRQTVAPPTDSHGPINPIIVHLMTDSNTLPIPAFFPQQTSIKVQK